MPSTLSPNAEGPGPGVPSGDRRAELDRLDRLAERMDSAFRIPGTKITLGWDSILGFVPGVGDTLALGPAAYMLYSARRMGAPKRVLARMAVNSGIDWAIGLVPLAGDIFDIGFKANRRNARLVRRYFEKRA